MTDVNDVNDVNDDNDVNDVYDDDDDDVIGDRAVASSRSGSVCLFCSGIKTNRKRAKQGEKKGSPGGNMWEGNRSTERR